MSIFTGFSEKSFLFWKENLNYGQSMGSDVIDINFSQELNSTGCSMGFGEIRFLKWRDAISSNSWILVILNRFSEGFPLFKLIFFLLKLKSILTKSIFHVSNLKVRELDPPTHLRQFDAFEANLLKNRN